MMTDDEEEREGEKEATGANSSSIAAEAPAAASTAAVTPENCRKRQREEEDGHGEAETSETTHAKKGVSGNLSSNRGGRIGAPAMVRHHQHSDPNEYSDYHAHHHHHYSYQYPHSTYYEFPPAPCQYPPFPYLAYTPNDGSFPYSPSAPPPLPQYYEYTGHIDATAAPERHDAPELATAAPAPAPAERQSSNSDNIFVAATSTSEQEDLEKLVQKLMTENTILRNDVEHLVRNGDPANTDYVVSLKRNNLLLQEEIRTYQEQIHDLEKKSRDQMLDMETKSSDDKQQYQDQVQKLKDEHSQEVEQQKDEIQKLKEENAQLKNQATKQNDDTPNNSCLIS